MNKTTLCDAHGVRHLMYPTTDYVICTTACTCVVDLRVEDVDQKPGVVTCFKCLAFEHGLRGFQYKLRGAPEIDLEAIQQPNCGEPWGEH
jgi:hypothetical protein